MADFLFKTFLIALTIAGLCECQGPERTQTSAVYRYRFINWCIVGQGEHPLYKWPLNQLKPYLLDTNDHTKLGDVQNPSKIAFTGPTNLALTFNKIQCQETKEHIGDGSGNYVQRAHVKFTSDVHFQGLVIQAVHQPFGLGFPFGQFDIDSEFKCNDCTHDFSEIIGCISRPDVELMHPTVGAFHYKLRKPDKTTGVIQEVGAQQELHWNFKWADSTCSSAKAVEFWVLMIFDFDYRVWMVKKFGPYDFSSEKRVEIGTTPTAITQPRLPSPIYSSCQPLEPTFAEILESDAVKGLAPIETIELPRLCYREYGLEYNATLCYIWKERKVQVYLASDEGKQRFESKITCHTGPAYDLPDKSKDWSPLRIVGDFDWKCITKFNREGKDGKVRASQPYKICKHWQGRFYCTGTEDDPAANGAPRLNEPTRIGTGGKERYFPLSICEPCTIVVEATVPQDVEPGFIKRGVHGGMMVFAFFFFLPVSITICRFYKETLHTREVHGWRMWLFAHVGMAMFVVLMSYISYTLPAFFELDAHMYLGYAALFCCAGGLGTGWFRHKSEWVMTLSFYAHSLSGYAGWGLAIGSMVLAPGIGPYAQILCYIASGFSLAAMALLTCHICIMDHKIEMTPGRSHIPIVQIRFDDLFPPGHMFRKFFLVIYAVTQFSICCFMMTIKDDM